MCAIARQHRERHAQSRRPQSPATETPPARAAAAFFASTGTVTQAPTGANALVDNSGTIQADGGRVLMTARAARDVINNVINVTGIVEARSARIENGEIVIDGGENGIVSVNATLDASGQTADAKGGTIKVLGEKVGLFENARLDASGDAGGGTVLVGGNYQGNGPEANAKMVYMDARAVIDASSALADGGRVILWSDEATRNAGHIDVSGAVNGGFIEVSSKGFLDFRGTVGLRGASGNAGSLLLDPTDITITAGASSGDMSGASPFAGSNASSNLDVSVLNAALTGGIVTITTASGGAGTGNIDITAGIVNGAANTTLVLRADGAITIGSGGSISSGGYLLNVSLRAGGNIVVGGSGINTLGGYVETTGTSGAGYAGGSFTNTAAINLGTGNLTLGITGAITFSQSITSSGTVALAAGGAINQTYGILGAPNLILGGTGAITLNESTNTFANITLNRTGTTTNVSLNTSVTPNVQTSTLGTGVFFLGGVGFTQSGAIVQDALADSATIQGNSGTVTLSQANIWTGDVTVLGDTINVTNDQSFNIASSANLNLLSNGNIIIDRNLVATGSGSMNMIFNTRKGGGSYGYIDIQPTTYDISIDTNGGYIVMGGGSGSLTNALPSGAQAAIGGGGIDQGISIQGYDNAGTPLGVSIDTGGGNFHARGTGASSGVSLAGVYMYSTAGGAWVSIDTGAGNINIHGQGGNGADGNGVLLQGNSGINAATLRTTTGNITVTGVSGTGASSHGILAAYYSQIETAGGVLTLNGDSTGAGASRGFWSLGLIDAGTNAGSTIAGTSLNEYGVLLAPAADWRVGSGGQLNVTGEGTNGLGADGVALTLNGGTINFTGEGTSGQGVNLSGAITFAGDGGQLRFIGAGANGDVIVSGSIEATGTTGARSLEISSSGLIQLQGTPSTTTIGATVGGMLNFSATAADSLTLGGKIVTEGGAVSLVAGTKMSITAGIETFGGGISIMGNAPGGSITGANYSGAGNGVEIKRLTAATVAIDAGGGDIYIAGVAGDTGGYNIGVLIDGAQVTTTGSGDVQIYGKGGGAAGGGDSYQVGVFVNANDFFFGNSYSNSGSISAGTGGLTITGEGGSAGADGSNHGVLISKAPVTSAGFINIEGTGGSGPGSDSILIAAGSVTSTGTASDDIILLANATLGGGFGLSLADGFSNDGNSVTIGGMSFQGNLFLHANTLSATTTILELSHQSGSGTIQFQTATATLGIGINGGDAGGGMAIGAGVLNGISGFDRLVFGGSGQIGAIQMDSTTFGAYAGLASVDSFEVRTQGLFYSNTLDFNGKAVVIDTGGASGGTLTNFDSLVLTGTGGFTGTANGGTLLIDKTGTSASIDVTSASTLTLGASTMGSGTLTLSGLAITQIGPLTQDAIGGNVNFTSSGLIALGQSNTFTGTSITIEGASVQINAQQNFTRGDSQTVNLISTGGNVSVNADLVKTGMGGAHFNITADETAWFANAGIQSDGGNITIWGNAPNGDNNVSGNAGGAWGVRIDGANAILSAGAGNIDIVGKGWTDNGTGQHGIVLMNGGRLETDTGYIILSGRGGSGTGSGANGIMLGSGASIESQGGYIELYGYGGANSANANGVVLDGGSTITHAGGGYVLFMGNGANGGQGVVAAGAATVDTGAGQLSVMSNSGISLDSVLLRAGGSATFVGGAGNIALNNASNDIAGTTTFTTAVGNVSFVNSYTGTLTLGGSDVAGYLAIQTGGGIDQAGAPSHVTGATNITAGGSIELTNADNTFGGAVTLTNTGGS
ncbi:MAG: hypothetical protein JNJ97_00890, partial [Alphaproteobacteria bacterium]|nr:hypothetical protein [Alphaproteobacteria bacterium]